MPSVTAQGVKAGKAFVELFSKNDTLYKGLAVLALATAAAVLLQRKMK